MPEQIKLDGTLFGYDTLVKDGSDFIALLGEGEPELYKYMKVILLGDSRGYIPSFFNPGEEATIIGFRECFKDGNSDHIIQVRNGTNEGWVKPSNIQKNVAESRTTNSAYRKIRQHILNITFAEFMDAIFLSMTDTERRNLPVEIGPFIDAMVSYALQRLTEFGELLAKAMYRSLLASNSCV
jgi:hypothetical protein